MSSVQIIPEQQAETKTGNTSKTSKTGKLARWSHEEEAKLIGEIGQGLTFEQIATAHGRTVGAIDFRLATLGRAAIETGMSSEEAMEKYKFTAETMKKLVAKKEAGKKKGEKAVEQPQLPFAATPQDRMLAYNQFTGQLKSQVDTIKSMGVVDASLEAQIVATLAYASLLIDQLGAKLA